MERIVLHHRTSSLRSPALNCLDSHKRQRGPLQDPLSPKRFLQNLPLCLEFFEVFKLWYPHYNAKNYQCLRDVPAS